MSSFDNIAAAAILGSIANEKEMDNPNRPAHYNLMAASAGLGLAVGLELVSPTGSMTSAIAAGVVGGVALGLTADFLDALPQRDIPALLAFSGVAVVSMKAGRITADYFPGNLPE